MAGETRRGHGSAGNRRAAPHRTVQTHEGRRGAQGQHVGGVELSQAQGERPGGGEEPRGGVGGCRGGVSRGSLQQRAARAAAADAPQVGCRKSRRDKAPDPRGPRDEQVPGDERGVRAGDGGAGVRRG